MTPEIITAEVVEVPRPERPDLWIAIRPKVADDGWLSSHPYVDQKYVSEYFGSDTLVIKIPGTASPPPPAKEADAVVEIDSAIDLLNIATKHCANDDMTATQFFINEALQRLAKIRGAR